MGFRFDQMIDFMDLLTNPILMALKVLQHLVINIHLILKIFFLAFLFLTDFVIIEFITLINLPFYSMVKYILDQINHRAI